MAKAINESWSETIVFSKGIRVRRGDEIGSGCQRTVFECDYTCRGKEFVLKRADGSVQPNRSEYSIYRFVKGTEFEKYFPEFKRITSNGRWLLVEKCRVAEDEGMGDASEEGYFPQGILHDDHSGNWGWTLYDEREVIIDMAHGSYGYKSIRASIKASLVKRAAKPKIKRKPKGRKAA